MWGVLTIWSDGINNSTNVGFIFTFSIPELSELAQSLFTTIPIQDSGEKWEIKYNIQNETGFKIVKWYVQYAN